MKNINPKVYKKILFQKYSCKEHEYYCIIFSAVILPKMKEEDVMKLKKFSAIIPALLLVLSIILSCGCSKQPSDNPAQETKVQNEVQETQANAADENQTQETDKKETSANEKENETDKNAEEDASEDKKSDKESDEKNDKSTTKKQSAPTSKKDIVALFNKSANKIKADASKVVKNFEKRIVNEDKTVIPAAIETAAEEMIQSLMGDDTKPITFATKEEIKENFIVPQQNYVSRLSPDYVLKAECKDNGSTYEIYLKLKDHKNPTAGIGVGAACDVIETHEIAQKASFIKEFSTTYYNCEIKATMNKSTGRITHIVYSTPLVMNMTVSLFGTHSGSIGFTFIKDYTITY